MFLKQCQEAEIAIQLWTLRLLTDHSPEIEVKSAEWKLERDVCDARTARLRVREATVKRRARRDHSN